MIFRKPYASEVASWSFLTNHARVLLCVAHDPGVRLRDIAASLGITERSAHGILTDLSKAGYVLKQRDGRRNRYQVQAHLPLPESTSREQTIGEVLALLTSAHAGQPPTEGGRFIATPDRFRGSFPARQFQLGARFAF